MAKQYKVVAGDTLSSIGKKLGVDYNTITGYKSGNPNLIYAGETLTYDGGGTSTSSTKTSSSGTSGGSDRVYKSGDFGALQKANPGGFIEGGVFYASQNAFDASNKPKSQEQVTPYLNNFQNSLLNSANTPATRVPTAAELKSELAPATPAPAALNRLAEFEKLLGQQGTADLEKGLNSIKDQIRQEQDLIRKARGIEEGKPVPLGVIQGRVSEQERVANTRIDELGREQSRITDELNTKYNLINTVMNFMGLDYNDAVQRYDKEYTQNLAVFNTITGLEENAKDGIKYQQSIASANLTTLMNTIKTGNLDYGSLSEDQQLMINKLEIQAGMPMGTIASVRMSPDANIVFNSTSNGVTQIGIRESDGTIRVEKYGTPTNSGSGGGTVTERAFTQKKSDYQEMDSIMTKLGGKDGIVSGKQWSDARSQWVQAGYDTKDFDAAFNKYTNPSWDTYQGLE